MHYSLNSGSDEMTIVQPDCAHGRRGLDSLRSRTIFAACAVMLAVCPGVSRAQSIKSVALSPAAVVGGKSSVATITLTQAAGSGGLTVTLTSNRACAHVPASALVPASASSVDVTVTTTPVALPAIASIMAASGGTHAAANLSVQTPKLTSSLTFSPATVAAGQSTTCKVTLTGPAPTGGYKVPLAANGGVATVPANVTVLAGATYGTAQISTNINLSGTELVSASLNGTRATGNLVVSTISGLLPSSWPKGMGNVLNTGRSRAPSAVGNIAWTLKISTNSNLHSPVVGPNGILYASSDDGFLYAIYPNGTIKWHTDIGAPIGSSPAVARTGTIYFGANDNKLYAVNPDGTIKWSFPTGLNILSSPTVGPDGSVYFGSADGHLYALHPDGTLKWSFAAQANIYSSPALSQSGILYIGSEDNFVYAVNSLDGSLKWSYRTGHVVRSSPAIGADGTIYVGSWDTYLYALSPAGVLKWKFKTGPNSIAFASPAIASDGTVYIGSWNAQYYALRPDGTFKWSFPMPSGTGSSPSIASDGTIYAPCDNGNLYALSAAGALKWTVSTSGWAGGAAIGADGTVYASLSGTLYAIR